MLCCIRPQFRYIQMPLRCMLNTCVQSNQDECPKWDGGFTAICTSLPIIRFSFVRFDSILLRNCHINSILNGSHLNLGIDFFLEVYQYRFAAIDEMVYSIETRCVFGKSSFSHVNIEFGLGNNIKHSDSSCLLRLFSVCAASNSNDVSIQIHNISI